MYVIMTFLYSITQHIKMLNSEMFTYFLIYYISYCQFLLYQNNRILFLEKIMVVVIQEEQH
jgi:hypothetical protein